MSFDSAERSCAQSSFASGAFSARRSSSAAPSPMNGDCSGERLRNLPLPLDPADGTTQSFEQYVAQLSATTGMPRALCRTNAEKIRFVLAEMERILGGLTRGLDLSVLDEGSGTEDGRPVSYRRQADALGVVLPSNSPGVHSLWLPAIPLKTPLVLKPGAREPWTPLRVAHALLAAGCPPEAVSYYPSSHDGATQILLGTGRSMLFGDEKTVGPWARDPRVELHGPGWSKVVLGPDAAEHYEGYLPLVAESVAANGGRSCINASGLWLARPQGAPSRGREAAVALARELAEVEALPLDHPDARLAARPVTPAPRINPSSIALVRKDLLQSSTAAPCLPQLRPSATAHSGTGVAPPGIPSGRAAWRIR